MTRPCGRTTECREQDVNRRSLEPHQRAPLLEEAPAPSWKAHVAASLRALGEPQAELEVALAAFWSEVEVVEVEAHVRQRLHSKGAFLLDLLAVEVAVPFPPKRQPFHSKSPQPRLYHVHRILEG